MALVRILPDSYKLAEAAADHFVEQSIRAIQQHGRFSIALAGGSTPQATYRMLASETYASRVDWEHVHVFWGDERCVTVDHPDSNYRMAKENLLSHVPIREDNLHRMRGELLPEQAAREYESDLLKFFGSTNGINQPPSFDLILLGLGEDGHIVSLFSGSPALQINDRWVAVVEHNHPPPPLVTRLSLTLPVLNAAAQVTFLVSGTNKAERFRQVLSPAEVPAPPPAQLVKPLNGQLLWLVDRTAFRTRK